MLIVEFDVYLNFLQGDKAKIGSLVHKLRKKKGDDALGHLFVARQFYKPTDCDQCHEPLWDSKNQGMECSGKRKGFQ